MVRPGAGRLVLGTLAAFVLCTAFIFVAVIPMKRCPTCLRDFVNTGKTHFTIVTTSTGCYGVGRTECPDCRGRDKVTLLQYWRLGPAGP